ncbi:recombinase RecT [Kozakia baliensis]|uniref:recombinase RecT n=1 Tax=Kozakia baliensis TaxID=153496 RepID=UPI00126926FE|nr:recombinase RecT [Kozakia baliensis]
MNAITTNSSQGLTISGLGEAMKLAEFMSRAKTIPQHLQGSPGDCLMIVEQSMRWQMSPFAVAQATSIVRGKLCHEGKLIAAAVQTSGVLDGRLNYEYTGSGDTRKVTVSGLIRGEKSARTVEVVLKDVKTENQWWTKTPDQMLSYHGARVWARRHTPEVMLGVYAPDEFDGVPETRETIDVTPQQQPDAPRIPQTPNYIAQYKRGLAQAENPERCIAARTKWIATVAEAEESENPIPSDIQNTVMEMIDKRQDELAAIYGETHEADDLEHAPA